MLHSELEGLKTPCYIICEEQFRDNIAQIKKAFRTQWKGKLLLAYSVKTNHNKHLMQMAKEANMLAETVSDDEYLWAEKLGFSQKEIIYNGVQKSKVGLLNALQSGSLVNLDNFDEISWIEQNITQLSKEKIHVGLRVNFDLEAECPGETTAGTEVSRFGFCIENGDFGQAMQHLKAIGIRIEGLHLHYSSKSRSLRIFSALSKKACEIIQKYSMQDDLAFIDIGGGFFGGQKIAGKPTMEEYAEIICDQLKKDLPAKDITLILEPGASIIATAIDYVSKVIQVKTIRDTHIITIDGSNLHINPFMAERQPNYQLISDGTEKYPAQIICGATCMENDRILRIQNQTGLRKGDFLYCRCVGAYTMAFNNCFINLPPYIYVHKHGETILYRDQNAIWLEEDW